MIRTNIMTNEKKLWAPSPTNPMKFGAPSIATFLPCNKIDQIINDYNDCLHGHERCYITARTFNDQLYGNVGIVEKTDQNSTVPCKVYLDCARFNHNAWWFELVNNTYVFQSNSVINPDGANRTLARDYIPQNVQVPCKVNSLLPLLDRNTMYTGSCEWTVTTVVGFANGVLGAAVFHDGSERDTLYEQD